MMGSESRSDRLCACTQELAQPRNWPGGKSGRCPRPNLAPENRKEATACIQAAADVGSCLGFPVRRRAGRGRPAQKRSVVLRVRACCRCCCCSLLLHAQPLCAAQQPLTPPHLWTATLRPRGAALASCPRSQRSCRCPRKRFGCRLCAAPQPSWRAAAAMCCAGDEQSPVYDPSLLPHTPPSHSRQKTRDEVTRINVADGCKTVDVKKGLALVIRRRGCRVIVGPTWF